MVTQSGASSIVLATHSLPVVPVLADHAGDEVEVDLREAEFAGPAEGPVDLVFEVGAGRCTGGSPA